MYTTKRKKKKRKKLNNNIYVGIEYLNYFL